MPIYNFICETCQTEVEEFMWPDEADPECVNCKTNEHMKKQISGSISGVVELSGRDLKDHLKKEGQKLKARALTNENVLGNMVGESVLHNNLINRGR
jgi:putative FmdB family regulatory protein